jgi:hypothetical protein
MGGRPRRGRRESESCPDGPERCYYSTTSKIMMPPPLGPPRRHSIHCDRGRQTHVRGGESGTCSRAGTNRPRRLLRGRTFARVTCRHRPRFDHPNRGNFAKRPPFPLFFVLTVLCSRVRLYKAKARFYFNFPNFLFNGSTSSNSPAQCNSKSRQVSTNVNLNKYQRHA